MTDKEFRDWLDAKVLGGRMTVEQREDLLEQKQHFDLQRSEIEQQFPHRVVGYVGGRRTIGENVQDLLAQAQQRFPNRMVYFEPIGFDLC